MTQPMIRRLPNGKLHGGDVDTGMALFRAAMVWDGNHPSKSSRDHFIAYGYAYRVNGLTALTGKGKLAMLHPKMWPAWFRRWRKWGGNPFHTERQEESVT